MSIVFKIAKKIIALLFALLISCIMGILLWRILSSGNPASMKVLNINDRLVSAYGESEELYMFRQRQRSITSGEKNYGYFAVTEYAIIPDANQIQAVVRYNNSTLRNTEKDYGLEANSLKREQEVYDISILVAIDRTPDNKEDNLGNEEESVEFVRCKGTMALSDTRSLYNYRRMVFQLDDAGIELRELMEKELLLAIYADICYVGDVNYDKPYGTLCLYDYVSNDVVIELEKRDVKAIETYKREQ